MNENDGCLMGLFERLAQDYPDRPAVVTSEGEVSYRDLMSHVDNAAKSLIGRDIVPETPIAVCADRSLPWIVAALAVLRAGGVYVPLDPMAPLQRKIRIMEDMGVKLLLVEPQFLRSSPNHFDTAILQIDHNPGRHGYEAPHIFPEQAAYGIYTSGSAGNAKSVIVSHGNLGYYAGILQQDFMLTHADRYLHTASLVFSASIRQLVAPLVSGAASVIATRDDIRDLPRLIARMLDSEITVFDTVPSYLARWLTVLMDSSPALRHRMSTLLRLVFTTGEPLPRHIAKSLKSILPNVRVFNLYGQTETTGTVALHEVNADSLEESTPIGKPLGSCQFFVLSDSMETTGDGELYIAGPCIARGYQGRPDITATSFLPNPFSSVSGSRMYRTGDRVSRIENGLLLFAGRKDSQVKLNGVRIELTEIDNTLLLHPDVQEAVTVLRSIEEGEVRLVAFITKRPGLYEFKVEDLQVFLAGLIPEIMIPKLIVLLEELPRTASGKLDRPALTTLEVLPATRLKVAAGVPRTTMEQLVARCWEGTLKVGDIGIEDDFFELGGDSIQAIEMMWQLQKLLPQPVHLGALFFQEPKLEAFARAIDAEIAPEA